MLGGEVIGALHRFLRLQCEFVPTDGHDDSSVQVLVSSLQVAAGRRHDSRQDAGATTKRETVNPAASRFLLMPPPSAAKAALLLAP